jgi:hypothetical protein
LRSHVSDWATDYSPTVQGKCRTEPCNAYLTRALNWLQNNFTSAADQQLELDRMFCFWWHRRSTFLALLAFLPGPKGSSQPGASSYTTDGLIWDNTLL